MQNELAGGVFNVEGCSGDCYLKPDRGTIPTTLDKIFHLMDCVRVIIKSGTRQSFMAMDNPRKARLTIAAGIILGFSAAFYFFGFIESNFLDLLSEVEIDSQWAEMRDTSFFIARILMYLFGALMGGTIGVLVSDFFYRK
jgi:hypothetical protein